MNPEDIMVSVLVTVYNHEKYLNECLESIIKQKTNFKYEILVHDDCSTDNSKKIIEKFYQKYPNIIIPFYEKENQYSKGIKINKDILIPKIKGKYFCFCEGDDYWIDENKMQKQFDFLENNQEYKFCVCNAIKVNKESEPIGKIEVLPDGGDLKCEDFIINGGGFVATNSIFSYAKLAHNLPKYFNEITLDYFWQIYLSSAGKTYCFKDYMSAYRVNSENSWSLNARNDYDKHFKLNQKIINGLKLFNKETNYKYNKQVNMSINNFEFENLKFTRNFKKMKTSPYKEILKSKPIKKRIAYFLDEYFPSLYNYLYKKYKK